MTDVRLPQTTRYATHPRVKHRPAATRFPCTACTIIQFAPLVTKDGGRLTPADHPVRTAPAHQASPGRNAFSTRDKRTTRFAPPTTKYTRHPTAANRPICGKTTYKAPPGRPAFSARGVRHSPRPIGRAPLCPARPPAPPQRPRLYYHISAIFRFKTIPFAFIVRSYYFAK